MPVPCLDGVERPYRDLDCAASTPSLQSVADRVNEFLPWYSSVHRGAGYKSRRATEAYEAAHDSVHRFARRPAGGDDVVVMVRNTTEAINHLAYRLGLGPDDAVATTVVEHHANLLPWARVATRRWVECGRAGTFGTADVVGVLEDGRRPALLALTGASNVTGWLPRSRRSVPRPTPAGSPSCSTRPSWPRTVPCRRDPTSWPSAVTSSTRPSAPARSSGRAGSSSPVIPSSPVVAPSTWSTSTRSSGPIRPSVRRPAHPTSSARSPSGRPWTSSNESAGRPFGPTRAFWRPGCTRGCGPSTAYECSVRHPRRVGTTGSRSPPSPWRGCITPWWRRG